jgi:hypothetical protein
MKKRLLNLAFRYAQKASNQIGLKLSRVESQAGDKLIYLQLCATPQLYKDYSDSEEGVSAIVFSKDRPAQLDLLLRSIKQSVSGLRNVVVLYSSSTEKSDSAYDQITCINYGIRGLQFVREQMFADDLKAILKATATKHTMFLVDDILFRLPIDLKELTEKYRPWAEVFSPRLGRNTTHCYTRFASQRLPDFERHSSGLLSWSWTRGEYDFGYPLSLDGHIFATTEIRHMIGLVSFKSPNSLESALQTFLPMFNQRLGICHEESLLVNVPCNRVQSEIENRAESDTAGADFLEAWAKGAQIQLDSAIKVPVNAAHFPIEFRWVSRGNLSTRQP